MADKTYVVKAAGAYVKRAGGEVMDFLHRGASFAERVVDPDHLKHLLDHDLVVEGGGDGGLVPEIPQPKQAAKSKPAANPGEAAG